MNIVYILRHSKTISNNFINMNSELEKNKFIPLSKEGMLSAKNYFENKIFDNIPCVYCSDYKRSYDTAIQSGKKVIIDDRLGERIAGVVDNKTMTPLQFFYKQVDDENYCFKNGENRKQIEKRMYNALMDIISINEKSIIVTHGTSLTFLLMRLCKVEFPNPDKKIRKIIFNNKIIFEGEFKYLETFKLIFNGTELVDIQNIK